MSLWQSGDQEAQWSLYISAVVQFGIAKLSLKFKFVQFTFCRFSFHGSVVNSFDFLDDLVLAICKVALIDRHAKRGSKCFENI